MLQQVWEHLNLGMAQSTSIVKISISHDGEHLPMSKILHIHLLSIRKVVNPDSGISAAVSPSAR